MSARRGLTPEAYRRITSLALAALAVIIVSGAAVRLTGSGLGCTDWPNCTEGRLVASADYHELIEFVNRVFTGAVSLAVALAVAGSLRRVPYRRDLVWWSLGLVGGVFAQIIIGKYVVEMELVPGVVILHFLVSMVLVWNAVVLHHRASWPTDHEGHARLGPIEVDPRAHRLVQAVFVGAMAVVVTGTIVTGSGPHGGDENAERLPVLFRSAARVHGSVVLTFLALTVCTLAVLHRTGAPARVRQATNRLLIVLVVQGTIGYVQYFTKVPVVLVGLHILGATLLWIAVVQLALSVRGPVAAAVEPEPQSTGAVR